MSITPKADSPLIFRRYQRDSSPRTRPDARGQLERYAFGEPGRRPAQGSLTPELLTSVLDQVNDAVVVVDKQFRIAYWGTGAERLYGIEASQAVGTPLEMICQFLWDTPEGERAAYEALATVGCWRGENVHVLRNGKKIRVESAIRVVRNASGTRIATLAVLRDVSDRYRAQEELRESETRLNAVLESITDAFVTLDLDWRYTYVNQHAANLLGRRVDELVGRSVWELFPFLSGTTLQTEFYRSLADQVPIHLDWFEPSLGRWCENHIYPSPHGLSVVWRDITDQKRTEETLHQSEERFRHLAEALPHLVFATDENLKLVYLNSRWRQYCGHGPDAEGSYRSLVHPDDRQRTEDAWHDAVRSSSPLEYECRLRDRTGAFRWFLVRGWPIKDAGTKAVRWVGSATDIHDLRLAKDALSEADRRKNEFLAMLSHELRNPLAPIGHGLYILDHAPLGSDQACRARAVMTRQLGQLTRLVDDLLDVTRISRNKIQLRRERVELNELARRTVEDHRKLFDVGGVRLELAPAPDPIFVNGDWNRLAQVIGNLLQNAVKFCNRGGGTRLEISQEVEQSRAVIRISDNGIGIAPQTLSRLFEPFTQEDTSLDRRRGGLGLGLSLVKMLLEIHGGDVSAQSAGPGKGATFTLHIPLDKSEVAPAKEDPAKAGPRRRRILIIEDNVDAADSLHDVLEVIGHDVEVARSGPEGVAKAHEYRPQVVLCDIGLPGMDGYQVARALRADESLGGTALVALSGYALPEDLKRAADAGFQRHLAKPANLEKLETLLESLPPHES